MAAPPRPASPAPADRRHTRAAVEEAEPDCYRGRGRELFVDRSRRFGKVTLKGPLRDRKARLKQMINIRRGDVLDLCKLTFLRERFDRLGYHTEVLERSRGTEIDITVTLRPIEYVRHVYIRNNWPLFKDEVLRRVRYRPGTRLPAKNVRQAAFERQKRRIKDFLRKEGYFNSRVKIVVEKSKKRHAVDLLIKLKKGSLYKLGRITVRAEPLDPAKRAAAELRIRTRSGGEDEATTDASDGVID